MMEIRPVAIADAKKMAEATGRAGAVVIVFDDEVLEFAAWGSSDEHCATAAEFVRLVRERRATEFFEVGEEIAETPSDG